METRGKKDIEVRSDQSVYNCDVQDGLSEVTEAERLLDDDLKKNFECKVCLRVIMGSIYKCPFEQTIVCETCLDGPMVQRDIKKVANIKCPQCPEDKLTSKFKWVRQQMLENLLEAMLNKALQDAKSKCKEHKNEMKHFCADC